MTEGARLVKEWCVLKDTINLLSEDRVRWEEVYEEKKRTYDTILADVEDRLAIEKAELDGAKQAAKEAENRRKEVHAQLKLVDKSSGSYSGIKAEYDEALAAKKLVSEVKKVAQEAYDQALDPFSERLEECRQAKNEIYGLLKETKDGLAENIRRFEGLSKVCFEHTEAQTLFDQEMTSLAETSIDVRRKINLLKPVRDQAAAILRSFVAENPTGWSTGAIDAAQRYLVWINQAKTHGVVLEDNPTYDYSLDDIVNLVGMSHILEHVKVDKSKLESAAKAGNLVGRKGESITLEQLSELRKKALGTPRLKAFQLGELTVDEVMITMAQELYERRTETLKELSEKGKLPKQTVTALCKLGITKISQLQRQSLQHLAMLYGIGEKRAAQIFRVLLKR